MKSYTTTTEYIASFPKDIQPLLKIIRATIKKAAPKATEKISYGIPTFELNGNLVHFGGFKTHIGFFPGPAGISAFEKDLAKYKTSKGTIQFPLDKPLPLGLITKIVKFRVKQNTEKVTKKAKVKKK
ncbi:MAG: DUF1801 domain-containing protein [Candidatus Pacebacteria bacterium]|nr:DUF1801 domain-containing protein [Candidatus Paceibacterota bacterium]MBP9852285.1 DUF1801 domain-containing protein [Candidatus Paceibacterota bacterium]